MTLEITRVGLDELAACDESVLKRSAVKMTHVGEQTGPVLTILISSLYYLPKMELFGGLRGDGLAYPNDSLPFLMHFSVTPREISRVLSVGFGFSRVPAQGPPSLVFSALVVTEGVLGDEFSLGLADAKRLHAALPAALDEGNGVGRAILAMQRDVAYR